MEKVILFQIENRKEISALASNMKIRVIEAQKRQYNCPLSLIAEGVESPFFAPYEGEGLPGSMLVFCDVTEKHLDRFLFGLRQKGNPVDYKAVLTPINRNWTPQQLYYMLERERNSMEKH